MSRYMRFLRWPALGAHALLATLALSGLGMLSHVPAAEAQVCGAAGTTAPCVGKGDIVNKAVTASKIKRNSIFSPKIIDRSIRGIDIGLGEVGFAELAPDAVFAEIFLVRATGTPQANCIELLNVLSQFPVPNAMPALIKLEPGEYDCGTQSVIMQRLVDVEGSGQRTTVIRGSIDSSSQGVVRGNSLAELRQLRVENTGGSEDDCNVNTVAIDNASSQEFRISDVTALAGFASGTATAIRVTNTETTLRNVHAIAQNDCPGTGDAIGIGVFGLGAHAVLAGATAEGIGSAGGSRIGLQNANSVTARNSVLHGDTVAVSTSSGATANIAATQLDGGRTLTGTYNCVGAYGGGFGALGPNC